ncbi:IQ motif containing E [Pitangus sulphuratus]|nr:IQ motif containing E [Pitangus sulphuratus]
MARGAGEAAAEGELGDDSLSVITCESDTEMKLKKIFHKPPKSPRTSHPLKSDVDMGHVRTNISSSTPDYLKEALGMKKPKHSRSSSSGYIPGTPDYKEKEDMYDEIIELKKTIQAQKNEGDRMKTKLRRLEQENSRKDKQIEQLLDPSRGSELARALSEKKSDNGWVVRGLKQKILKLEQQCKEKDNTINEFQADTKTSNLEEVRLAMETYYEEVHRLQLLLAKSETMRKNVNAEVGLFICEAVESNCNWKLGSLSSPQNGLQFFNLGFDEPKIMSLSVNSLVLTPFPSTEGRDTQKRLQALNAAVLRLSRNIKELQAENRRLKEDLDHVLSTSPPPSKTKNYSEWSRQRLVRRISELEKKVCAMESTRVSPADSDSSQLPAVSSSPSADLDHPASHHIDHAEECHRLQREVKKLKSDRKVLQNLLLSKELDIKQLLQAKAEVELELQKWQSKMEEKSTEEQTLSEEIQNLTQKVEKLESKLEEEKRQMAGDTMENLDKSLPVCTVKGKEDHREEQAAKIIQRHWKMYKTKAVVVLQAALRGHLARQRLLLNNGIHEAKSPNKNSCVSSMSDSLSSSSDCEGRDEVVTFIQSVFRAHLARTVLLEERSSVSSALSEKADSAVYNTEKKPVSAALQKPPSVLSSSLPDEEKLHPLLSFGDLELFDSPTELFVPRSGISKMEKGGIAASF